jgi:pyruvate dehydrogenase E2 component (dihydrolipoamide acetyltransferase)
MIDIHMPRLSDTMEEGAIAAWHKKPGDKVTAGEILVEIETDKAVMEHEAYDSGTLHEILVREGEQATIGQTIARIDDGRVEPLEPLSSATVTATSDSTDEPAESEGQSRPSVGGRAEDRDAARRESPQQSRAEASDRNAGQRRVATPLVRRLAREHAIDLNQVAGTGPGGRIVRADIEDALEQEKETSVSVMMPAVPTGSSTAAADPADARGSSTTPFDKTRQVISRRLTESSNTTPHFSVTTVVDVEDLLALRAQVNDQPERSSRPKVSVNDLIVRACAIALRLRPGVNASYSADSNGGTQVHGRVNIGIAVASDAGLVVPVIAEADQKTVSQIAAESKELASLAQSRRLMPSQMTGGTFTVSNLGMFGVEHFTAIINPPEGAILAVGSALPEPVAQDGVISIRHRMRVTLSADHRIIDGALAARFLQSLRELLEHPMNILA